MGGIDRADVMIYSVCSLNLFFVSFWTLWSEKREKRNHETTGQAFFCTGFSFVYLVMLVLCVHSFRVFIFLFRRSDSAPRKKQKRVAVLFEEEEKIHTGRQAGVYRGGSAWTRKHAFLFFRVDEQHIPYILYLSIWLYWTELYTVLYDIIFQSCH